MATKLEGRVRHYWGPLNSVPFSLHSVCKFDTIPAHIAHHVFCLIKCFYVGVCDCSGTGHSGSFCEVETDHCSPASTPPPCLNAGRCFNQPAGFLCSCPPEFSGANCATRTTAVPRPVPRNIEVSHSIHLQKKTTCPFKALENISGQSFISE